MAAREAYSPYVGRAAEGANEADGPLSASCYSTVMAADSVAEKPLSPVQ
jgi:hypothetical protein